MERRIAAILATDMVGFSRLIEADEEGTLNRKKRYRLELIEPSFARFHGKIIKFTGDGLIAEFGSVVEAVQCAVHVQNEISERELDYEASARIQYRMAVNLGDVVFDDGDVFGDGVNVAARLESIAPAGGVVVSGVAYDLLKNQVRVSYQPLGKKKLKNIATPVRVYSVLPMQSVGPRSAKMAAIGRIPKSIIYLVVSLVVLGSMTLSALLVFPKASLSDRLTRMTLEAQRELEAEGYLPDYEPGEIGVNTRKALSEFQADNEIEETGIISAKTAEALGVSVRIYSSDWEQIRTDKRKALLRQPEIFEYIGEDERLAHAARVLEGLEFAFGYFEDNLYVVVAPLSGMPWTKAIETAEKAKGYLTSISSREENEFVFELSSQDPKFWRRSEDGNFWTGPGIGLYQEQGADEPAGGWRWLNGEDVAYTNWANSQPNNWGGFNERTATYYSYAREVIDGDKPSYDSTWNDERIWSYSFVVEIE